MTAEVGKREAHKVATRLAIQTAADRLFDQRGYANTTVRDITDAAGVTERTFYRYFPGKEALLVKDIETWLPVFGDTIRQRPVDEEPLDAVQNAFVALRTDAQDTTHLDWLFHDGPPGPRLERSAPGLLLKFEGAVADALLDRGEPDEFVCQVIARCAVAAMRSAGLRRWQLGGDQAAEAELFRRAFAIVRQIGR